MMFLPEEDFLYFTLGVKDFDRSMEARLHLFLIDPTLVALLALTDLVVGVHLHLVVLIARTDLVVGVHLHLGVLTDFAMMVALILIMHLHLVVLINLGMMMDLHRIHLVVLKGPHLGMMRDLCLVTARDLNLKVSHLGVTVFLGLTILQYYLEDSVRHYLGDHSIQKLRIAHQYAYRHPASVLPAGPALDEQHYSPVDGIVGVQRKTKLNALLLGIHTVPPKIA
jgi:hypothetical protein